MELRFAEFSPPTHSPREAAPIHRPLISREKAAISLPLHPQSLARRLESRGRGRRWFGPTVGANITLYPCRYIFDLVALHVFGVSIILDILGYRPKNFVPKCPKTALSAPRNCGAEKCRGNRFPTVWCGELTGSYRATF